MKHGDDEITIKLVYYGVGLAGKTSNLQYVYSRTPPESRSKMTSHASETERLLFFDFLPQSLAPLDGKRVRLHLVTVPGSVYYDASRKMSLDGVDGIVAVIDSQVERIEANEEILEELEKNPALVNVPIVMQYNKRDLPNRIPLADLESKLNPRRVPCFDTIATTGIGVYDTLKGITRLVLRGAR